MLGIFIMNKINDSIASSVSDEKLMEFGLVYGDILSYRGMFPPNNNSVIPTYKERAAELKDKIRRAHPIKKDKRNRFVFISKSYRIEIKLKCYENNKFKLETKKSIVKFVPRDKSYDDIHLLAREHFNIPKSTHRFLGEYNGNNISKTFENIDTYPVARKEKKMKIQLYLHYPKSYTRLTIDQLKNIETISSDVETELSETVALSPLLPGGQVSIENNTLSEISTTCFCTYINKCLICEQNEAYAMSLTTDSMKESEKDTTNQNHINLDSNIAMENDDSSQEGPNIRNLREVRLKHFRQRQPPVRYRHSVVSPNLLMSDAIRLVTEVLQQTPNSEPPMSHCVESHDISNFENYCYGDEEVERFFGNDLSFDQDSIEPSSLQQLKSLLHTEKSQYLSLRF